MTSTFAFAPVQAADLHMTSPGAVSAAIPLFVIGLLLWRRVLPRVAALLALLAGTALSHGWLYTAIHALVTATTTVINLVTRTTLGGVVPGGLALILTIYYVLQVTPDEHTFARLAAVRARRSGGRGYGRPLTLGSGRVRPRWPEKLGALGVGLFLPAVAATIPGSVGATVTSAINIVGGLGATALANTIGIQ